MSKAQELNNRPRTPIASRVWLAALSALALGACSGPPLAAWKGAQEAGTTARESDADFRAASSFRSAETLFDRARLEVELQNHKWALWRDYSLAESLFVAASRRYVESSALARRNRAEVKSDYGVQSRKLQARVRALEPELEQSVAQRTVSASFASAQLNLDAARHLAEVHQYDEALALLSRAETTLDDVERRRAVAEGVNSDQRHIWSEWVDETLADSRRSGERVLIVDKAAHKTYLVRAGKLVRTWNCELGYNSGRDKTVAGDGATPEGRYRVTMVRNSGSKYYKALMLSYPNEHDRQEFRRMVASGAISSRSRIGGLIEIHGNGGRGSDWTDGCVALTNGEMDELMPHAFNGMQVTIVRRSDQWP